MDAGKREPFEHPVLHGAFCKQHRENAHGQDPGGYGQAAGNTFENKYNSPAQEVRRACHEYLYNKSGDDSDDLFYTMGGYRECLQDMGQPVPDGLYEHIILHVLSFEYKKLYTASYERRGRHSTNDECPVHRPPNNSSSAVGRGVAIHVTGGDDSAIKYYYCSSPGHRQKTCVAWIAA